MTPERARDVGDRRGEQRPDSDRPAFEDVRAALIERTEARLAFLADLRQQIEDSALPAATTSWLLERITSYEAALRDLRDAAAQAESMTDLRDFQLAPAG